VLAVLRLPDAAGTRGVVVGLLVLALCVPLDAYVHPLVFRYVDTHAVRLAGNGFTQLGTAWAATGLLGGLALVAHRVGDLELLRASVGGVAGVVIASLANQVAKQVACRGRPRLLDGWSLNRLSTPTGEAGAFFHWPCAVDSRYHSFPSGHAATAFALAAALSRAAPARRRVWLAVAAGVGASRVVLNAHFVSDALAGGLLGWWGGWLGQRVADRLSLRVGALGRMPVGSSPDPGAPRA
jgi:membrane-associated phospholipid phosphatase